MSFWSDASPIVKGAIIIGLVCGAYLLVAYFAKIVPFVAEEPVAQERGLPAPQ